ncbi:MAG: hypothetical protein A2017_13525 [Lentisphaerae bacterium GWF2_44_16]|nr:MAG: hypothetical protein A2017_13525 [Lentisphaerae bacterium GWF2_44_16]
MVSPRNTDNKGGKNKKALLLGIGFDNKDGHSRMTKGENFYLAGGSEETHERMVETAIKVNEKLKAKGKSLEEVSKNEFIDIISEAGSEK